MVNHYYFYGVDRDFGPVFLKFCAYVPYNAKLCLNGHEYVKRQLAARGIAYEALDNGILSCAAPEQLQALCDGLSAATIETFFPKWLARLPHPFTLRDRRAGYRYQLSILQAEFSLTQVFDRPLTGRIFFDEVIRENRDRGRPDQIQLIFARRVRKQTPGRFRTRVITEGVTPSRYVDYKHTRIKQYPTEGRALRTETTINDAYDFEIGRRLSNLSALRKVGFQANRRLLDVQRISHDCTIGEATFARVSRPATVDGQRAAALRFADPVVQALLSLLVVFRLRPDGWRHRDLAAPLAALLGVGCQTLTGLSTPYGIGPRMSRCTPPRRHRRDTVTVRVWRPRGGLEGTLGRTRSERNGPASRAQGSCPAGSGVERGVAFSVLAASPRLMPALDRERACSGWAHSGPDLRIGAQTAQRRGSVELTGVDSMTLARRSVVAVAMAQTWFYCGQRYYDRRWTWAAEPGASTCTSPARSPSGFA